MGLNRGQQLQLLVAYAVASRTAAFVEALLDLYERTHPSNSGEAEAAQLAAARQQLAVYRDLAADLAQRYQLAGDPRDLRPIIVDQVFRLRDALSPRLVDGLPNYGALSPADERALRHDLASLSLLTEEIARAIQRLPARYR
jgi:hypothetical protein